MLLRLAPSRATLRTLRTSGDTQQPYAPYAGSYAQQSEQPLGQTQQTQQPGPSEQSEQPIQPQQPQYGTPEYGQQIPSYGQQAPQYTGAQQYADAPNYSQQQYAPGYGGGQPSGPGFSPAGVPPLNKPYYGCPFPEAIKRFFQKYIVFKGRASKSEFWWVILGCAIVSMVLGGYNGVNGTRMSWLSDLWNLAIFIPSLAIFVRRLHDSNKSGWWAVLPYGLFFFTGLFGGIVMAQTLMRARIHCHRHSKSRLWNDCVGSARWVVRHRSLGVLHRVWRREIESRRRAL
jgi:uncharacterized membrane protein YhaH (DUF805 family)